jgi:multidrug resistance efflux pump
MLGWLAWNAWVAQPWTRDGRVRVYVVSMAPEVAGRIVQLKVRDNQFVHKDDVLMVIDPSDYAIAVANSEAALQLAAEDARNKAIEADRRKQLSDLATSNEERQTYVAGAQEATAAVNQAQSRLAQARVNLKRTAMVSPVNGWVTNLQAREGD